MSRTEVDMLDSSLFGPGLLFINQYFNTFFNELFVLWIFFVSINFVASFLFDIEKTVCDCLYWLFNRLLHFIEIKFYMLLTSVLLYNKQIQVVIFNLCESTFCFGDNFLISLIVVLFHWSWANIALSRGLIIFIITALLFNSLIALATCIHHLSFFSKFMLLNLK